jgi:outer membrane protein assembly factor BamB
MLSGLWQTFAMRSAHLGALWLLAALPAADASDWPQFLGPTRDGVYAGNDLGETWPKEGPPIVWQKTVGQGFSGPVVAAGKLVLFHRLGDREVVECLEAASGKALWSFGYATGYHDQIAGEDHGPRATPAIAGGKVFTFGAEGKLHCLTLASGERAWAVDTRADYGAREGFFGFGCSPLIEGSAALLNLGGLPGAGIVALGAENGRLLWKATDDEASYSSPIVAPLENQRVALFLTRAGLVGLEPASGAIRFTFPWRSRMHASVNAATPVVVDDLVFLSASYQTGAVLLRARGAKLETVWSGDDVLSNHYGTSVHWNGYLFGFDGRQEQGPRLRCVELRTGKIRWTQEGLGAGSLLVTPTRLLALLESGLLLAIAKDPDRFRETGRAQLLGSGVRACPALADGRLYARGAGRLVCVDLRKR